jgi:hypothetical protein
MSDMQVAQLAAEQAIDWAKWLEAIGSALGGIGAAIAAVTAVILWRADRRRELQQAVETRRETLRNLVAGLKAEIRAASIVATGRREALGRTLANAQAQLQRGGKLMPSGPISEGEMTLTDGIIYSSIADRLGLFTPAIVGEIVNFFTHARDIERVARMSTNALHSYETIYSMLPRFRMNAAVLLRLLEKYEEASFDPGTNLGIPLDEMRRFATETEYPLDEVMRERGFVPATT